MEISSSNLLDNLIYRANIFNYDTKFLNDVREKNLTLDLNEYNRTKNNNSIVDISTTLTFLKRKSPEQIEQVTKLVEQREIEDVNIDGEEEHQVGYCKDARSTMIFLLDLILFSQAQLSSTETKKRAEMENMEVSDLKSTQLKVNSNSDNILYALLYLDGLMMFNIDFIKCMDQYAPLLNTTLSKMLFDIMNDQFVDNITKEVASHLLAADMAFTDPDNVGLNSWRELMNWTLDYYTAS